MRVLMEYKNKRVDIKMPISKAEKVEETPEIIEQMVLEAKEVVGLAKKGRR